jgi:hypothetical protein
METGGFSMKALSLILLLPAAALASSIVHTINAPDSDISGLGWNGTSLWAVDHTSGNVYELDPANGSVLFSFHPDLASSYPPHGLTAGNDTLFVSFVKESTGAGSHGMYDGSTGSYLGTVAFC